jgi:hypothetical protein
VNASTAGPLADGAFACWNVTAAVRLAFLGRPVVGCAATPHSPRVTIGPETG